MWMVQAPVDVMQHAKVDKRENGMSWTDLGGARVLSSSDCMFGGNSFSLNIS